MAAELVDPISLHPYPFVPSADVHIKPIRNEIDCHHAAHPRRHRRLQGVGGRAVREAIGQFVGYADHHLRYHPQAEDPILPRNDAQRCRYVAFALAGYLSKGICFRPGIEVVTLENRHRERLWYSGERRILNEGAVREFVVTHLMDHGLSLDSGGLEEEFFEAEDPRDVRLLGHQVLASKIRAAVEGFADNYETAYAEGLLRPDAPNTASKLLHEYIGDFAQRDRIVTLLHRNGPEVPPAYGQTLEAMWAASAGQAA